MTVSWKYQPLPGYIAVTGRKIERFRDLSHHDFVIENMIINMVDISMGYMGVWSDFSL